MFSKKHIISTDQKGFRTNKKINYTIKNEDALRIFTIGASTTEQATIDDQKTWSTLLAKNLEKFTQKKLEVINTGVAGLRAEHHYFTFRRIKKYNPDLIIFLMGINDWNYHIINDKKRYLIPKYEIVYNFKKSFLYKIFSNINKQIRKKITNKKKVAKQNIIVRSPEQEIEAYLLPQINSLNKRTVIKDLKLTQISQNYRYWLDLIIDECTKNKLICIFLDQPTAYQENISEKLKKRLWMTPPNQEYTLTFENLIMISSIYNNWMKKVVTKNKSNFCSLSDKISPNTKYLVDDCHFSEYGSKIVSDVLANCIKSNLKSIPK